MNEFSVVIDTSKDNYVQLKLGYKHASGWHFLGDNFKFFPGGACPQTPLAGHYLSPTMDGPPNLFWPEPALLQLRHIIALL